MTHNDKDHSQKDEATPGELLQQKKSFLDKLAEMMRKQQDQKINEHLKSASDQK